MGIRVGANSVDDRPTDAVDVSSRSPVPDAPEQVPRRRGRAPQFNVAAVTAVGVLITAGLSLGAYSLHNSNEDRLLGQRAREVGVVLATAIPTIQTPLASAAVLAESTDAKPAAFRKFVAPLLQPQGSQPPQFTSVSLWPATGTPLRPLLVVGHRPVLASEADGVIRELIARAAAPASPATHSGRGTLAINNLLATRDRRLGFAYASPSAQVRYVVYVEAPRPRQRRARVDSNAAFSELDYAVYLGAVTDSRYLLASSTGGALLHGRRASTSVDFGDSHLLVVLTPRTDLGGTLLARLWWILGAFGLLLTFGAASLVGRLSLRRRDAESLAIENARLYAEQRSVAQTLQHSLLAEAFPEIGALEFGARYVAGVEGIDIGGDWYDIVRLDHDNILMVVGDVSGRGLEAATMMASLRYAARAYAVEGHSPATILTKLSGLASVARDGHFATVLCGSLDVTSGTVTVANAGHPAPLLIGPTGPEFIETPIGVPIGVRGDPAYREVEFAFPRGSTLLLYTDGAIERRGERLDVGLQRLKDATAGVAGPLELFLDAIVNRVLADGTDDDTAMLGVRWRA